MALLQAVGRGAANTWRCVVAARRGLRPGVVELRWCCYIRRPGLLPAEAGIATLGVHRCYRICMDLRHALRGFYDICIIFLIQLFYGFAMLVYIFLLRGIPVMYPATSVLIQ